MPTQITEYERQAKALEQCLVWNDYPGLVIEKKAIMVFLQKKGKPWATVELNRRSKKIIQFRGHENTMATPEQRKAFEKWSTKFLHSA